MNTQNKWKERGVSTAFGSIGVVIYQLFSGTRLVTSWWDIIPYSITILTVSLVCAWLMFRQTSANTDQA